MLALLLWVRLRGLAALRGPGSVVGLPWPGICPRSKVNKHARRSVLDANTHAARSDKVNEDDKPAEMTGNEVRGVDTAGDTPT